MQDNNVPEWFLLDLPPINLYTANLLMPYYNGVEGMRMDGIIQPLDVKEQKLFTSSKRFGRIPQWWTGCVKLCKLDKQTQCCIGCGRSIEEIIETGKRRTK